MLTGSRSWGRPLCLMGSLLVVTLLGGCAREKRTAKTNPPGTVKVAAIQCSSELGAVEENREKLTDLVREAASKGAKIIVLPETSITGYVSQDLKTNWHVRGRPLEPAFRGLDPATAAEAIPGPSTKHFCALAKQLKIYLTIPLLERVGNLPAADATAEDN